jgi:hypothetical protein
LVAARQDKVLKRCLASRSGIEFLPRLDENILWQTKDAQATVRALRTANGSFAAFGKDNQNINAAVFVWRSPGIRAIKPDLL